MASITLDCIETFVGVPEAFVDGGLGEFFHAHVEMIWNLMGL